MESYKLYKFSLFIFRRDLRIFDNSALIKAFQLTENIIPVFFLDERQINKINNPYFSSNCVQFMLESICDLKNYLNNKSSDLILLYGNLNENLENLLFNKTYKIEAVFLNQDYTPFSIMRDLEIKQMCNDNNIHFHSEEDLMLTNLNEVINDDGEFFKVFTHYYKKVINFPIRKTNKFELDNFLKMNHLENLIQSLNIDESGKYNYLHSQTNHSKIFFRFSCDDLLNFLNIDFNDKVEVKGGRSIGMDIIKNIIHFKDYAKLRRYVHIPSTRLSGYLKFGCISIREVYEAIEENLGKNHELIKHLHVRDFFMKIAYFNQHVFTSSFKSEYDKIKWEADEKHVEAWKNGSTGFPIVDAAMRCLNETGYIHNKLRNLVVSFLVKDILADWRIGEKYFATKLLDYDISLNNGGWQWTASTGTDPKSLPRIYHPSVQSEKIDPQCEFILKWIPQLKNVEIPHIHNWEKFFEEYKEVDYPSPIFSHKDQIKRAFEIFDNSKLEK